MNGQKVWLAGLAAMLAIGVGGWQATMAEKTVPVAMAKTAGMSKVLMTGKFVKAEHPTAGGASVVMQDGKQYLMLDQQFKSDAGPDLFVLLHREAMPKNYAAADYVNLGKLKQLAGAQMYEIPAGMEVAEYQSAVIWCKEFNATFGYAMLKS